MSMFASKTNYVLKEIQVRIDLGLNCKVGGQGEEYAQKDSEKKAKSCGSS